MLLLYNQKKTTAIRERAPLMATAFPGIYLIKRPPVDHSKAVNKIYRFPFVRELTFLYLLSYRDVLLKTPQNCPGENVKIPGVLFYQTFSVLSINKTNCPGDFYIFPGAIFKIIYLCTRAPAPPMIASTSFLLAMVVSPGVVIASAPCAAP